MLVAFPPLAKPFRVRPGKAFVVIERHIVVLGVVFRASSDRLGRLPVQIVLDEVGSRDRREGITGDPCN